MSFDETRKEVELTRVNSIVTELTRANTEATRQVHATHERIVTKSIPEPARKRPSEVQEAADTMKALKESRKTNRRQSVTRDSSKGTGRILAVPDESIFVSTSSSRRTGTRPGEEDHSKDEEIDWIDSEDDDEKKDDTDDDKSIDLEMTDDEETDDEVLQGEEQVNADKDEEMKDVEVEESRNGDEKATDAAKEDVEKTEEAKDDPKKAKLPPTSSSLSISSGFGDQFLKLSSDTSFTSILRVSVTVISEPLVLTPVQESPSVVPLRVAKLEQDVSELKKINLSTEALATLKEQVEKQKIPKYTIKSTDKAVLKEYDQKSALYQTMHKNKSFNRNNANHALYHALMEALIEDENVMDKGVANTVKDHKRKHDDDDDDEEDPLAGPN
nr:hypothetical protein [Tanacetum cinerariifolium]